MTGIFAVAVVQVDAQLVAHLERIAWAQVVTAIALGIIALGMIVLGIVALGTLRAANRVLNKAEKSMDGLAPRLQPLIESATRITTDVSDMSDAVRKGVNDVMDTVNDLNQSLRNAGEVAEQRVRDFGAVLDVVQQEAETILLDTAATARGLHTTAESLRGAGLLPQRAAAGSGDND